MLQGTVREREREREGVWAKCQQVVLEGLPSSKGCSFHGEVPCPSHARPPGSEPSRRGKAWCQYRTEADPLRAPHDRVLPVAPGCFSFAPWSPTRFQVVGRQGCELMVDEQLERSSTGTLSICCILIFTEQKTARLILPVAPWPRFASSSLRGRGFSGPGFPASNPPVRRRGVTEETPLNHPLSVKETSLQDSEKQKGTCLMLFGRSCTGSRFQKVPFLVSSLFLGSPRPSLASVKRPAA